MAIYRNVAAGGKWATAASWEEETAPSVWTAAVKAPGIADVVNLVKAGGTIEVATATTAEAKEILCNTGGNAFEKTLKVASTGNLKVAGSLIFSAAMTWSIGSGKVEITNTAGTAEVNFQGKEGQEFVQNGSGGTVKLMGAMPLAAKCLITAGTFETNGQEITCTKMEGSSVAKLKLGASTIKCTTTGEAWAVVEGTTVEAGTSTIELTNTSETAKKFHGGSKTYSTVIIASDNVEMQGNNTYTNLRINTRGKSVKGTLWEKGSTHTITGELTTNATEGEKIKFKSSLAGKVWKLKKTAGTVELTGIELQDSKGEGGATWRDVNGVNVSGNEGWTFVHEHSLSATQGQTITQVKTVGRTLSVSQGQTATREATLTRALTITQGQTPTLVRTPSRALSVTQGQTVTKTTSPARSLSATQGQTATGTVSISRSLTASQGQSPSVVRALSRALSSTQGQSVSKSVAISTRLTTTQVTTATIQAAVSRSFSVEQGQVVVRATVVSRYLTLAQAQEANVAGSEARTLSAGQGQEVHAARALARALSMEQGQAVTRTTTVARSLAVGQGQNATGSLVLARGLTTSQSQSASRRATVARFLVVGQGQSASQEEATTGGKAAEETLSATQGQQATQRLVVSRSLSTTQGQAAVKRVTFPETLAAEQGQSATFNRGLARGLNSVAASQTALSRSLARGLGVGQHPGVVLRRVVGRALPTAQTSSSTLTAARTTHRLLSAGQGQSAAPLLRRIQRVLTMTSTSTPRFSRAISRTLTRTQATTVVATRGVFRLLVVGQGQLAYFLRGGKATSSVEVSFESEVEAESGVASSSVQADMLIESTTEVRV